MPGNSFDLVQQGALIDYVELLNSALMNNTRAPINTRMFQSNQLLDGRQSERNVIRDQAINGQRGFGDVLTDFTRSPSVVPGATRGGVNQNFDRGNSNQFSTPASFVPNEANGLTLALEREDRGVELDLLSQISGGVLDDATSQSFSDLTTFGLRTEDPFGTPAGDRTRSILRSLVDRV